MGLHPPRALLQFTLFKFISFKIFALCKIKYPRGAAPPRRLLQNYNIRVPFLLDPSLILTLFQKIPDLPLHFNYIPIEFVVKVCMCLHSFSTNCIYVCTGLLPACIAINFFSNKEVRNKT